MRIPIPTWFDRVVDVIAFALFPSRKYITVTLGGYFLALTAVAAFIWGWVGVLAVALCFLLAWMIDRWYI